MKILMLITGGIAAYKTPSIVNALSLYRKHEVHIMTTEKALKFVTRDALMHAGKEWWNGVYMNHIKVIDNIGVEKLVIIPATANIIGKIAGGIGDDEVTTTCIKASSITTKIVFPSMNSDMWDNPIVQDNIEKILNFGWCVVDPGFGQMACGSVGRGVLPQTRNIVDCIEKVNCQREITITNVSGKGWYSYSTYLGEKFLISSYETDEYYHIKPDDCDKRLNLGCGSKYPVRKEDCTLLYMANLNRIDYEESSD